MHQIRQWTFRLLPLGAALLARPAFADAVSDAVDGIFTFWGCVMDGAVAGANMTFVVNFCAQYMDTFAH